MKMLVEHYLRDGQPVSSKYLAHSAAIGASPATVRNVMMNLEKMGLLASPHTSAGRIPTASGLRFFVEQLLTVSPIEQHIQQQMQQALGCQASSTELCAHASGLLSELTAMTGIVTVPKLNKVKIDKIELFKLTPTRLICVIVMHDGEVQNRVIETRQNVSDTVLQQTIQVMNLAMVGKSLDAGLQKMRELIQQTNKDVAQLSSAALSFTSQDENQVLLTGQSRLLDENISSELQRLRALFEAVSDKHLVMDIMEKCSGADGVKIFIGEESGIDLLQDCSVISAPYHNKGEVVGRLAVIGPTRMNYNKVIPIVDITARMLSSALNQTD
nr:heat-inducible transcriptional repressor HrcA [Saccharobesus litoralis]